MNGNECGLHGLAGRCTRPRRGMKAKRARFAGGNMGVWRLAKGVSAAGPGSGYDVKAPGRMRREEEGRGVRRWSEEA